MDVSKDELGTRTAGKENDSDSESEDSEDEEDCEYTFVGLRRCYQKL